MSIGYAIRQLRKQQKLTLRELATRSGVDVGNLSRIERNILGLSDNLLRRISQGLAVTPAYLYKYSEQLTEHEMPPVWLSARDFVQWFRSTAPYIHAFSGRVFVIAFGGELLDNQQFKALAYDINLLHSLNVRLVLVHGARPQIEERLAKSGIKPRIVDGLRITDKATIEKVKEANGAIRVEIEALLSMGLSNSPMAGSNIKIASGNFVIAKPLGVRNGVDFQYTGVVRKVDVSTIRARLEAGELLMLSPLGYSLTGEVFNLSMEDVAVSVAQALGADKLIFLMDADGVYDAQGELLREITTEQASQLLHHNSAHEMDHPHGMSRDVDYYLPAAIRAIDDVSMGTSSVPRVHLINRHENGGLIQELFTRDGIGTMVTSQGLDNFRLANHEDVGTIWNLLSPLIAEGTLAPRERTHIELDIACFYVIEHDRRIIGCAALYPFMAEKMVEFACFAVSIQDRNSGYGDRLFNLCVKLASQSGFQKMFCLSTRTTHWFLEHGFVEASLSDLPFERQKTYSSARNSKIFIKQLSKG